MEELAVMLLEENGFDNWEVESDVTLICPCGDTIEWDGTCSDGCVSPLIQLGVM
jgi:hypothetical protein